MAIEWRLLRTVSDDRNFATTVRNVMLFGAFISLASEGMGLISPAIPPDPLGTSVMVAAFLATAYAGHRKLARGKLVPYLIVLSGIIGWYHARLGRTDVEFLLVNQGAIFATIAGAQAVLPLSVVEFLGTLFIYMATLIATALSFSSGKTADFAILGFYGTAALGISSFGIIGRTRLEEAERRAKAELEKLNLELESKVREQVKKIARADVLRRFLPPELTENLMKEGAAEPTIDHVRRNVAIVCAAPAGFLESLAEQDTRQVIELVNAYVSALSQVAFDHGGVVERVVGPRMTLIFGAMQETSADEAMRQALETASKLQVEANRLLTEWEHGGFTSAKLRLAIGLAYGPAVVGTFGSERRVDYSALGGVMVRAVRLSSEAIPGEIRLDPIAASHVGGGYELSTAEPVEFTPGEPVPCYIAVAQSAQRSLPSLDTSRPPGASISLHQTMSPTMLRSDEAAKRSRGPDSTPSLNLGEAFDGRYRLDALVGRGGMATVYRAHHVALGQVRAIKVIQRNRLDSADAVEQFRREAEATARIHHPNVVRLHDFGRSIEGHYYLALDFIHGKSLAEHLDVVGTIPTGEAVRIASEILHALDAAHSRRLVHQDLKPSNVLLSTTGQALVTDFGLVTFSGRATDGASYGGTPAYMSPEQWMNQPLDARSDLYAWGVLLYEMLTGEFPLFSASLQEFAVRASFEEPVPILERVPHLPRGLAELIHACLEKKPEDRPASASELALRLREWADPEGSSPYGARSGIVGRADATERSSGSEFPRRLHESTARGGTPEMD